MEIVEKGICPFYKYKATDTSEILSCEAAGEFVPAADSDSLTKFATKIDNDCLGFDYVKCPKYKKKMKEKNANKATRRI